MAWFSSCRLYDVDIMLIFPTYQTILTKPAAATSSSSSFGGVTTDLLVHYDFSDTSCWNRNKSSNAADYTVNNLVGDHNDAHIRRKVSGTTWTSTSDSPVIEFNSDADGCIQSVTSNYDGDEDQTIIVIPGAESSSTAGDQNYNMSTVSSTSSNNLTNIGTGAWTAELWTRYYLDNSGTGASLTFTFFNTNSEDEDMYNLMAVYDLNWVSTSPRGDLKYKYYSPQHNVHFTSTVLNNAIPGAPSSGAGWTDWMHIVISKESGTSSGNTKVYINNTHEKTNMDKNDLDYLRYGRLLSVFNATTPISRLGIFRFYQGKSLTSSEVTTNWNAQKERFGH